MYVYKLLIFVIFMPKSNNFKAKGEFERLLFFNVFKKKYIFLGLFIFQ